MASIKEVQHADGSTSYKITVVVASISAEGKRVQKRKTLTFIPTATAKSKIMKEVNEAAVKFERAVKEGKDFSDGKKMTFDEMAQAWLDNVVSVRVKAGDITEGCLLDDKKQIRLYGSPTLRYMRLNSIKPAHIDQMIRNMLDKGLSNKTIRNAFNCIRQVFGYAVRNDLIKDNPCDRVSTLPQVRRNRTLHTFNGDQTKRFLNEALMVDIPRSQDWKKQEDQLFFTLALYGGFRKGELCALTWNDIDEYNYSISINKAVAYNSDDGETIKSPKTESGFRKIMLPSVCFTMLREWKQKCKEICLKSGKAWKGSRGEDFDDNYIFIRPDGRRISNREPYKHFKLIIEEYNKTVPSREKLPEIRLHDLRHTCASHLVAAGTDIETVARRLGHSNPSFTLDIYAHALEEKDHRAADALEELFSQKA